MRRRLLTTGLLLLLGNTCVFAQQFNYTYLELGYAEGEVENIDAEGYGINGSLALNDYLFGIFDYANIEPDGFRRLDVTTKSVGLGFNAPLTEITDLVLSASWVEGEVELGRFGSFDDDGIGLGAGIRTWLADGLELNVSIDYVDFGGNGDDDTGLGVGLVYSVNSSLAIGLTGDWTDDPDSSIIGIQARFYFGR